MSTSNGLFFLPLGGSAEIGMNLNLYAYQDQWLMVDLGISFHDSLGLDVIMPSPQYIVERKEKLVGLLLTHAHEDHIGAIPYLWPQLRCPIYATPYTLHLLRYKLEEMGLLDEVELHEIPLSGKKKIGPFSLQMVSLTHSIPEPNGVLIETPLGRIFHTGDWKLDPDPLVGEKTDEVLLRKIGDEGVLAMVCDSTNVFEASASGSEKEVFDNLLEVIKKYTKERIVVTCFASNVARLASIAKAAALCGRKVVAAGRSFKRIEETARRNGYLEDVIPFLKVEEGTNLKPEESLYICTGSQGEGRSALKRIASRSFSGITLSEGDVIIFSSRVIPGNERRIGVLKNGLLRQGCHVITQHHEDIHVSGHPGREELVQMYEWVRPKIAIPVHGELRHLIEHGKLAKKCGVEEVIIVDNGSLVKLAPGTAEITEEVPAGYLALDGDAIIRLDHPSLSERYKLSVNGIVMVSVVVNEDLNIVPDHVQMSVLGLVNIDNAYTIVRDALLKALQILSEDDRGNETVLRQKILSVVRRTFMAHMGKKPMVDVHITYL